MQVTHLVTVLDYIVHKDSPFPDLRLYRRMQVMWMVEKPWEEKAPHQNEVFEFDYQFRYGKVIELENVTALHNYFGDEGRLAAF